MLELCQTEWCSASRRIQDRLAELGVDYVTRQVPVERAERTVLGACPSSGTQKGDRWTCGVRKFGAHAARLYSWISPAPSSVGSSSLKFGGGLEPTITVGTLDTPQREPSQRPVPERYFFAARLPAATRIKNAMRSTAHQATLRVSFCHLSMSHILGTLACRRQARRFRDARAASRFWHALNT
jgi:hypothetical protein